MRRTTRLRSQKQAIQQAAQLSRIERTVSVPIIRTLSRLKQLAFEHQARLNIRGKDLRPMHDALLAGLISAHLTGKRSARQDVVAGYGKKLRLDVLDQVLKLIKTATTEDVLLLTSEYEPSVQKVLQNLTSSLGPDLRDALDEAVRSNVTPKAAIQSFFQRNGLDSMNPWRIETLLRTQTQLAYSAARLDEYSKPEINEIIWGYTYVTVGDDRVRPEHAALDGVTLPKEDPFWRNFWPPNGYNCRCQAIPVFAPEDVKQPPEGAEIDEGFNFSPDILLNRV